MKIQKPGIALGPTNTPLNKRQSEKRTFAMFDAVSAVSIPAIKRCANVLLNQMNGRDFHACAETSIIDISDLTSILSLFNKILQVLPSLNI